MQIIGRWVVGGVVETHAKERSDYTSIEEGEKHENKVTGASGYAALQADKALYAMTDERGVTAGKNQVYQDANFQKNMADSMQSGGSDTSFLRDEGGKNVLQGADFMAAIAESRARAFTMSQGMVDSQGRHLNATFDKSGNVKKLSLDEQFSYSKGGKIDTGAEFQAAWQAYAAGKNEEELNLEDFVGYVNNAQVTEAHKKGILGHLTAKVADATGMSQENAELMVGTVGGGLGLLGVNKMIGDPLGKTKDGLTSLGKKLSPIGKKETLGNPPIYNRVQK